MKLGMIPIDKMASNSWLCTVFYMTILDLRGQHLPYIEGSELIAFSVRQALSSDLCHTGIL